MRLRDEELNQQVEQALREAQAGRDRQDAGQRVAGSRKERAALRKLLLTDDELKRAEQSPGTAAALVKKTQLWPRPDFEAWRNLDAEERPSPAVAGVLFLIWKSFPDTAKLNTPDARMAYVRLLTAMRDFAETVLADRWLRVRSAMECVAEFRHHVLGYPDWLKSEDRKLLDYRKTEQRQTSYGYSRNVFVVDAAAQDDKALWMIATAVRRYLPADVLEQWLRDLPNIEDTSFKTDLTNIRDFFYDYPETYWTYENGQKVTQAPASTAIPDALDVAGLPLGGEPANVDRWYRLRRELLSNPRYVSLIDFGNTGESYYSLGRVVYMPRIVAHYYGKSLASIFFPEYLTLAPTKSSYRLVYREKRSRHPVLDVLVNVMSEEDAWSAAAEALGLGGKKEGTAPKRPEDPERRPLDHIRRKGGIQVTDDEVAEAFLLNQLGYRSVEYGKWVKDAEGTEHLRHFISATVDLCDVLNLHPREVQLAGGLNLAFGSRGNGGKYAAVYQSGHRLMALTKRRGDGTVAHEWLHYLDHLLAIHLRYPTRFASEYVSQRAVKGVYLNSDGQVVAETNAETTAQYSKRQKAEEAAREANWADSDQIGWRGIPDGLPRLRTQTLLERVWSAIRNGYYYNDQGLVACDPKTLMRHIGVTSETARRGGSFQRVQTPVIPVEIVVKAVAPGTKLLNVSRFDSRILAALRVIRSGEETTKQLLWALNQGKYGYDTYFTTTPSGELRGASLFAEIARYLEQDEITITAFKPVVSAFYGGAMMQKNAAYYADPVELFARSFETFVGQELAARGQANNYLVGDWKSDPSAAQIYPQGAEADLISGAWRDLFQHLSGPLGLGPFVAEWNPTARRVDEYITLNAKSETEETEDGVVLPDEDNDGLTRLKARMKQAAGWCQIHRTALENNQPDIDRNWVPPTPLSGIRDPSGPLLLPPHRFPRPKKRFSHRPTHHAHRR